MTQRHHLKTVTEWLNDLAGLTTGPTPLADAKPKITRLALALAAEYPAGAFTHQSVVAVATQCKWFPSYGEIVAVLSPWWKERRPMPRMLAAPTTRDQQERDVKAREDDWRNITDAEIRGHLRVINNELAGTPQRAVWGRALAAKIHALAPHKLGQLPPEFLANIQPPKAANDPGTPEQRAP